MHGDDVASAGISITTELVSKSSELIFEMLKVAIDEQRKLAENYAGKLKAKELSGGEVSLKKLKKGGQIGMLQTFEKTDLKELIARAKDLDIPVAVTENKGRSNTVSVFFNTKDQTALDNIVADIREETKAKQKNPEQAYKMLTIEKSETEGFQMYCAEKDIPVTFMETKDEQVKCIFSSAYAQQMRKAIDNYHEMQKELADISVEVVKDKGKPKIVVTDMRQGKKLTMNFCTKARLERMLNERLGFEPYKAAEVTNVLAGRLTEDQKRFYYSGSRTLEQMEYFEKDIRFEDDNILTDKFTFAKFRQRNGTEYLTITDTDERFVVLSGKRIDRKTVEEQLRTYLNIADTETIAEIMKKAERLGFAEAVVKRDFKSFTIERETLNSFTVTGGSTSIRLDLTDKKTAVKQLMDAFGIKQAKAERIFDKASKQSVSKNTLERIKSILPRKENALEHKTRERGSRK